MTKTNRIDSLIKRILKEEIQNMQELSPKIKAAAAQSAFDKYDKSGSDDIMRAKLGNQADNFSSHVDPETQKMADKLAASFGENFVAKISVNRVGGTDSKDFAFIEIHEKDQDPKKGPLRYYIDASTSKDKAQTPVKLDGKQQALLVSLAKSIRQRDLQPEEVDEQVGQVGQETEMITPDGTKKTLTSTQKAQISKMKPGAAISYKKAGTVSESEEQEEVEEVETTTEQEVPSSTEVAGQIAEILDKLKAISEGSQDPKAVKLSQKVAKHLEAAQSVLEALTAHETSIMEKDSERRLKDAGKKRKAIEKHLRKSVKMPDVVERLMKKLPEDKIADMLKKNPDLDEQKVAGAMMRVALKEAVDKSLKK